ncbi:MAG TPA: hypothetical protein PLZ82_11435 [Smithellaceae bacterium]|jgi:hypothetical protein|nr:hypothetical protein [Syntrophaceae bacterium]NMC90093.1 hypothetical protein [Smithella sp.]HNV57483.1 hypothetical protein [Smithellaceae bacterium]MBP8666808.1 hypothetical protein [Syntrophaceae bacterium]MBP9532611.1 hypothetical protein [Syntrophaceae bacterium]
MKKIGALVVMIGCFMICGKALAGGSAPNFAGTWMGEYCTMSSKEGLRCGKPMEIVIDEQQKGLVRGYIKIGDKAYPLSGTISENRTISYTDALASVGVLRLVGGKVLQMKAVNRCVAGNAECAHSGTFRRKK